MHKHKEVMERFATKSTIDPNNLADDVDWVVGGSSGDPFVGHYKGKDAVLHLLKLHNEIVEVTELTSIDHVVEGNKSVTAGYERIFFKTNKREAGGPYMYMFTWNDEGKIVSALILRDDLLLPYPKN